MQSIFWINGLHPAVFLRFFALEALFIHTCCVHCSCATGLKQCLVTVLGYYVHYDVLSVFSLFGIYNDSGKDGIPSPQDICIRTVCSGGLIYFSFGMDLFIRFKILDTKCVRLNWIEKFAVLHLRADANLDETNALSKYSSDGIRARDSGGVRGIRWMEIMYPGTLIHYIVKKIRANRKLNQSPVKYDPTAVFFFGGGGFQFFFVLVNFYVL